MSEIRKTRATDTRRRPRLLIVPAAVFTAVIGLAVMASAGGQQEEAAAPAPSAVDVTKMEIPAGKVPVASHEGTVAGFVDAKAERDPGGYPETDLGSGDRAVHALEVTDGDGRLVGYFVELLGFVDLRTARDDAAVDALLAGVSGGVRSFRPDEARELRPAG